MLLFGFRKYYAVKFVCVFVVVFQVLGDGRDRVMLEHLPFNLVEFRLVALLSPCYPGGRVHGAAQGEKFKESQGDDGQKRVVLYYYTIALFFYICVCVCVCV